MKRVLITTLSIILIFLTTNCEKYVTNFEFDEKNPKLVLNAILQPDSIIKINISTSQIFNPPTSAKNINNANISLYEDETPLGKPTSVGGGFYIVANHYPNPGSTYRVEASVEGYEPVNAETTVPPIVHFTAASHGSVEKPIQDCIGCEPELRAEFSLTLNPDTKTQLFGTSVMLNKAMIEYDYESWECIETEKTLDDGSILIYDSCYYSIADTVEYYDDYPDFYTNNRAVKFTKSWREYYISYEEYENEGTKVYYSTKNQPSGAFQLNLTVPYWAMNGDEVDKITFWVDAYDEALFQFMYSLAQAEEVDGDPFAEKVQIYSNVNNGLGIFGSVSSSSVTLDFDFNPYSNYY